MTQWIKALWQASRPELDMQDPYGSKTDPTPVSGPLTAFAQCDMQLLPLLNKH